MTAKRGNRTSALIASYPTTIDLPLQIVSGTAGAEPEVSKPAARGKKSKQSKAPAHKKPLQRNRFVQKQKSVAKRAASVKGEGRKSTKTVPSPVPENALPRLVTAAQTIAVTSDAEMTFTMDPALVPVLVMPEDRPYEAATLTVDEISADHCLGEECRASTENHAFVPNETIAESITEKPAFPRALALQWINLLRILTRTWTWAQQKFKSHQVKKRLRVCESVSLGEKRFIAVIQVDGEQFLVGGSSSSVSTLAHLEPRREFSDVFRNRCEQDLSQA